jgi:PIN domain nuclease of toxin-antitoxin system
MPAVADTHTLVWYLTDNPTLSTAARQILEAADAGLDVVFIPTAVIVEAIQIAGRKNVPKDFLQILLKKVDLPTSGFQLVELDREIAEDTLRFQGTEANNPIDRIVGSTSVVKGFDIITRDGKLTKVLTNVILP